MTDTTQPDPQVVAAEVVTAAKVKAGDRIRQRTGSVDILSIGSPRKLRDAVNSTPGIRVKRVQPWRGSIRMETHLGEIVVTGATRVVRVLPAESARKPLTLADIPAGQGPASLYLTPDPAHPGELDLMFKHADGRAVLVGVTVNQLSMDVIDALEAHLAATLPHVTAEEDA